MVTCACKTDSFIIIPRRGFLPYRLRSIKERQCFLLHYAPPVARLLTDDHKRATPKHHFHLQV